MYQASQTECAIFSSRQTYPHDVLLSGRDIESLSHPPTLHLCRCAELAWEPQEDPIKTLSLWQKACCLGLSHHLVMKNSNLNVTYGETGAMKEILHHCKLRSFRTCYSPAKTIQPRPIFSPQSIKCKPRETLLLLSISPRRLIKYSPMLSHPLTVNYCVVSLTIVKWQLAEI